MSEKITFKGAAALSLAAMSLITSCAIEQADDESSASIAETPSFESIVLCYTLGESATIQIVDPNDCDSDGIPNQYDVDRLRPDFGDEDNDGVPNFLDVNPFGDDLSMDSDNDTIPDFRDPYFGNNFEDADSDGWMNGVDPQPNIAPPGDLESPEPPTDPETLAYLEEQKIQIQALRIAQIRQNFTSGYNPYENDFDFDQEVDAFDPRPTNGQINSYNDRYDPMYYDTDGDSQPDLYDPYHRDAWRDSRDYPFSGPSD